MKMKTAVSAVWNLKHFHGKKLLKENILNQKKVMLIIYKEMSSLAVFRTRLQYRYDY